MTGTELKLGQTNTRQMIFVSSGALLVALMLFAIWYFAIRTPYAPAFTELKSADASLIVGELERKKTPYKLSESGTTIMVPEDQVDASRINILGGDLPLKGTVGFELFNQSDMGLTEFAQKINYQRALQGELARTLMALDNIETARVHLSLPESGIFERDKRAAKAAVTIAPKLGKTVDGPAVSGIQRLIASAVPDLETINVVVIDSQGQLLSQEFLPMSDSNSVSSGSPIEMKYAGRVRSAIAALIPDPNVRVTVKVEQNLKKRGDVSAAAATYDSLPLSADDIDMVRDFPIRISIILPNEPDVQMRDSLVPLLVESVDYDPSRGDSLVILTSPIALPSVAKTSPAKEPVAKDQSGWKEQIKFSNSSWIWLLLSMPLLLLVYFSFSKLFHQREMTLTKREAFSDRLRDLLVEQGRASSDAL